MKQNTKGFTLIELLAVIVILAIIALIAVPVVMNIIASARKSASADTAYSVLKAAENYYMDLLMTNPNEAATGTTFDFAATPAAGMTAGTVLEIQGTKPTAGNLTLDSNGTAHIGTWDEDEDAYVGSLTINGFICTHTGAGETVTCLTQDEYDAQQNADGE